MRPIQDLGIIARQRMGGRPWSTAELAHEFLYCLAKSSDVAYPNQQHYERN